MMRSIAMIKKIPTPTETVRISSISGISADTCFARICKSGSETVTITPMRKLINAISHTFFELPSVAPSLLPRGCMDISAPMVNTESPMIRQKMPMRNKRKVPVAIGVMVTAKITTIAAIGQMD